MTRHDAMEGGLAAFVDAVGVVHVCWPVQADAQQKVVFCKKLAPFVIQRHCVGLQRVGDAHARPFMLLLIAHRLPEEFDTHQGRLPALPGEVDVVDLLGVDVLADVFLEQVVRHAEFAAGIKPFLGEEVAILAIEVADGASRLGHQVEGGGLVGLGLHGWEYSLIHHRGTEGTEKSVLKADVLESFCSPKLAVPGR